MRRSRNSGLQLPSGPLCSRRDVRNRELESIDLRREAVETQGSVIVGRHELPGDPAAMRGADYDPSVTAEHHSRGRNPYLLSETASLTSLGEIESIRSGNQASPSRRQHPKARQRLRQT